MDEIRDGQMMDSTTTTTTDRLAREWRAMLAKYGLPATVEQIERGERGDRREVQPLLFDTGGVQRDSVNATTSS